MITRSMAQNMWLNIENVASFLDVKFGGKFKLFKYELANEIIDTIKNEIKAEMTQEFDSLITQTKKITELESLPLSAHILML